MLNRIVLVLLYENIYGRSPFNPQSHVNATTSNHDKRETESECPATVGNYPPIVFSNFPTVFNRSLFAHSLSGTRNFPFLYLMQSKRKCFRCSCLVAEHRHHHNHVNNNQPLSNNRELHHRVMSFPLLLPALFNCIHPLSLSFSNSTSVGIYIFRLLFTH